MHEGASFGVEVDCSIFEAEIQGVDIIEIEEETCTQTLDQLQQARVYPDSEDPRT